MNEKISSQYFPRCNCYISQDSDLKNNEKENETLFQVGNKKKKLFFTLQT